MTRKLVSLFIALCLVLSIASAFGEKLTVTAWDANFNGNALQAAADDYKANVDPDFELEITISSAAPATLRTTLPTPVPPETTAC